MTVTSYSGDRWTERVGINNDVVFNLSKYNISYVELGDPFLVNIPVAKVQTGDNIVNKAPLPKHNQGRKSVYRI